MPAFIAAHELHAVLVVIHQRTVGALVADRHDLAVSHQPFDGAEPTPEANLRRVFSAKLCVCIFSNGYRCASRSFTAIANESKSRKKSHQFSQHLSLFPPFGSEESYVRTAIWRRMGPGGSTGLQNRVARRNVARMVRLHPFSAKASDPCFTPSP